MKKIFYIFVAIVAVILLIAGLNGELGRAFESFFKSFVRYTVPSALVWVSILKYKKFIQRTKNENNGYLNISAYIFGFYTLYNFFKNIAFLLT